MKTDDVFEMARAIMIYRFSIVFTIIFMLPLASDIAFHMKKAAVLHILDFLLLLTFPLVMRKARSLDAVIILFFVIAFVSNLLAFMILNPDHLDPTAILWSAFFLMLGPLLLRGKVRILFCAFLLWIPIFYVMINQNLNGRWTIGWLAEKDMAPQPVYIMAIPIILGIKAVWDYSKTSEEAKRLIFEQKAVIETKNKEMTDSIHYAKRIQDSLLPNEKGIQKNIERLNKE